MTYYVVWRDTGYRGAGTFDHPTVVLREDTDELQRLGPRRTETSHPVCEGHPRRCRHVGVAADTRRPQHGHCIVPWVYLEEKVCPFTGAEPAIMTQKVYAPVDDCRAMNNSATYLTIETVTGRMLSGPPREQHLVSATGFPFREGNPYKTTDKFGVECRETVASYVKDQEVDGALMSWFPTDAYDPTGLFSLEVYKDEGVFNVHKECDAVVNNRKKQMETLKIRTGVNIRVLKQEISSFN